MGSGMAEIVSYCGLICEGCAIYLATREKDEKKRYEMRVEIVDQIREHYSRECKPEDVTDCDGCKAETGRLYCTNCEIRECARQKNFENCSPCNDYPCEKLTVLFITDAGAKERLDRIRRERFAENPADQRHGK